MSNKETLQSYNNRLNANNTSLDDILDIIDNLPEAGGGGSSAGGATNVYIQADEPSGKKGLWLQTDETLATDVIISDERLVSETILDIWVNKVQPPAFYAIVSGAIVGDEVFWLGGYYQNAKKTAYKYNAKTNVVSTLPTLDEIFGYHATASVGQNIYLFGGYHTVNDSAVISDKAYCYNTSDGSLKEIAPMPDVRTMASAVAIGTSIYIIGGRKTTNGVYQTTTFVYDTITDTYDTISGFPGTMHNNGVVAIGSKIYILNSNGTSSKNSYVYDLATNTLSDIAPTPNAGILTAVAHNDDIYYFIGTGTQMYKYDTLTDTHSPVENVIGNGAIAFRPLFDVGGKLVRLPVYTTTAAAKYIDTLDYTDYMDYSGDKDGTIIYQRSDVNKYHTELVSASNVTGDLLYGFEDVIHYTTANGVNNTIPTYYGNGSEWIKFKN